MSTRGRSPGRTSFPTRSSAVPPPRRGGLGFPPGGDGTGNFYAFDARTGKELWRFQCGAGVNAAPISFEVDGEQFIAVAAGGNFQLRFPYGDGVFVFGLPKKR